MKIGDIIYTRKHIAEILDEHDNNMLGVRFTARDGSEVNYNIVSPILIESMINQKEWFMGEDPWK